MTKTGAAATSLRGSSEPRRGRRGFKIRSVGIQRVFKPVCHSERREESIRNQSPSPRKRIPSRVAQGLGINFKSPFVRKGRDYTAGLDLDLDTLQGLRLLAPANKLSEKKLCALALAIYAQTVFTGASLRQFYAAVERKVAKPAFKRYKSQAEVLIRVMADAIKAGKSIDPEFKFSGLRIRKMARELATREMAKR